ncbi:MAG TPA: hypothetical protein VED17_05755 [Nitrososphaerales archaeon]|nr:hypothetical protein [Nitrososphaerales archaeon]
MRTGSVGNRNAEDMVKTLVKEKKVIITSVRDALLHRGYLEDVEYDSINIEPVLIFSKAEKNVVLVRHKWETNATIPFQDSETLEKIVDQKIASFLTTDEEGKNLLRFKLPDQEKDLLLTLDILFPN